MSGDFPRTKSGANSYPKISLNLASNFESQIFLASISQLSQKSADCSPFSAFCSAPILSLHQKTEKTKARNRKAKKRKPKKRKARKRKAEREKRKAKSEKRESGKRGSGKRESGKRGMYTSHYFAIVSQSIS